MKRPIARHRVAFRPNMSLSRPSIREQQRSIQYICESSIDITYKEVEKRLTSIDTQTVPKKRQPPH